MRRRSIIAAIAVTVLVVTGQLVAGTSSSAAPPPPAIPFDGWGLRESLRKTQGDAFGGLYAEGGNLILAATGGSGPAVSASAAAFAKDSARTAGLTRAAAPPIRIREVANSLNRLQTVEAALLAAPGLFDADGPVNLVGIDDSSNTVRVGLDADTPANRAAVLKAAGAAPTEVSFRREDRMKVMADRYNDVAPFNAGNRIYGENSQDACSSGFGVHQAGTGVDYLLTAAHCSEVTGQQDFFWNGDNANRRRTPMGFSTNVSFGANGWDTQLIRAESSTITWTATDTRSHITAAYTPVDNDANRVINEGSVNVPWQSGLMTISRVNFCTLGLYPDDWGVVRICHLWEAKPPAGACAGRGGDSGGPVVSYSGFGPLAVGQIIGGDCSRLVFHAIGDMIAQNPHAVPGGLYVNTVSDPG